METIIDIFLKNAAKYGPKTAVMDAYGAYTYDRLNLESAKIASGVLDECRKFGHDVETSISCGENGERVAVLLPRSREYMAAFLGVLRAGCAIVPLDSEYPKERIRSICSDAGCRLFVTTGALAEKTGDTAKILIEDIKEEDADTKLNLSHPDIEGLLVYTSGSTGKPKGVVHRQSVFLHYYMLNKMAERPLPDTAVHCCMAGFTFIASLFDLTIPILSGAQVYIADEKERQSVELLWPIINKRHVTSMFLPPKMFMVMRELYGRLPLRNVELGGEKADPRYADDGNIFEAYASSETFCMLFQQLQKEDGRRLGKPAAGTHAYLLDDNDRMIKEAGTIGELCVVSPWLATGYNNLPQETAAKFTDCPFEPGQRMYRTGDYFSYDENGNYLFRGRKDRMVKLRGYRVELGEIESVLKRAGGVEEAACVAIKVNGGDKLCCYYTGEETDADSLKAHAAAYLPEYMVPDYIVRLSALPRNERNKVNYLALKELDPPTDEDEYTAPESETEKAVCEAFGTALNITRVSVNADFFKLGGTSLSASVLVAALSDMCAGLSFQDIIRHPSPARLAEYIAGADPSRWIPAMDRDKYPLTKTQMGIYLEALTGGNGPTYTVPFLIKTDPLINADDLIKAVKTVISAHPSMKYMIKKGDDNIPYMFMTPDAVIKIPVIDGREEDLLDFMKEFMPVVPMTDDLLIFFSVYRTDACCYLAVKTHLIFFDGTSVNLFIDELNRALGGEDLQGEDFTIQQAAMREDRLMKDGTYDSARKYHEDLFKSMDAALSVSGDLEGPLTPGVSENLRFEPGTLSTERVAEFCEQNQITESSFFMGAMAILLGKYLNGRHVSFSTVYNGRAEAGMENTIGTLIKRIPIYGDLSRDMPVTEYLKSMSRQVLTNMSNDIYSFDEVLKNCPVNEEVEFIYQGNQFTEHGSQGKSLARGDKWFIEHYHTGMVTGCFSIQLFSTAGFYNMTVEYRNERFSREWVERFAADLFTVSQGLLTKENIADITLLTDEDVKLLADFNDTSVKIDFVPVHEQIHRIAINSPKNRAVTAAGRSLSFKELDLLSDRVAFYLKREGVTTGSLVGVLFKRNVWVYVAEIGILKAGGAFVPFIPDYPGERIDFCMNDAHISLLLTTSDILMERNDLSGDPYRMITIEDIFETDSIDRIEADAGYALTEYAQVGPGDLSYCIYTSGTTGRPKGVMIEHGNIANYVNRNEKSVEIMHYADPGRKCLALASFSFDVSVVEEFVPLCNGNGVVIATEEEIHSPELLSDLILTTGVTGITCTPTYLISLLDIPRMHKAIEQLSFFDIGAEVFPTGLYDRLRSIRDDSVILNVYGPTEATMGCSAKIMNVGGQVTVGRPIANTCFYVADTFGNELPPGIRGELIICGDQVGRGYIGLPDKTAESFFTHKGMRAYHSGDLAAWTWDGSIRLFGRIDDQIKLRGFRIELDEIEKVMTEYPGIKTGVVDVRKNNGTEYLVGYYTAAVDIQTDSLRKHMQEKLPEYMVPHVLLKIDSMPLTANGKVDKRSLPAPDFSSFRKKYRAAETELEKRLCAAFAAALKIPEDELGVDDDFFELGGDSLGAILVLATADIEGLGGADIFKYRTPFAIAAAIEARKDRGSLDEREEAARKADHPLTPIQIEMIDTQLFRPSSTMWSNLHFLLRFDQNEVEAGRLCDAVNKALKNHPALSTSFGYNEECQIVQRYVPGLLPEVKVKKISQKTAEILPDVLLMPFDRILDSCLLRAGVYSSDKYTYLFMDIHHLLMDGASIGVIIADIVHAFNGEELSKDYYFSILSDEERMIREGSRERDHEWFKEKYGDEVWCNMPPCKNGSANIVRTGRMRRLDFDEKAVKEAEGRLKVSRSVMAITAALTALGKVTGKKHVMINWIFNNRLEPEALGAVGMLMKNLPVAARLEEYSSMRDLLGSVKEQVTEGIAHRTYDFMTEQYQAYISDCMEVNFQFGMNGSELKGLNPTRIKLNDDFSAAGVRLELILLENEFGDGGFDSDMEYAEGMFDREVIEGFHDLYIDILQDIVAGRDIQI